MNLNLRGKAAAVMAASDGLGKASALALAEEGCRVAICARGKERLEAAAKEIRERSGVEVVPVVADVSRPGEAERFVGEAARALGGLDVLVTNKGGPPAGRFDDLGDEAWERSFQLVVMSTVRAIRAALAHFRARGGGSVVLIESTSVRVPIDNLVLSNSLRPAAVNLARTLALELAGDNVRVNAVLPGFMSTDRARDLAEAQAESRGVGVDEVLAARMAGIPLKRAGNPRELGDVVAFLASERASYVTGAAIPVDGGLSKGC